MQNHKKAIMGFFRRSKRKTAGQYPMLSLAAERLVTSLRPLRVMANMIPDRVAVDESGRVQRKRPSTAQAMKAALYLVGSLLVIAGSFFTTIAIIDNFGRSMVQSVVTSGRMISQIFSPGQKVIKSEQLDLRSTERTTGALVDGRAVARAPKDQVGYLLISPELKLGQGSYRADISFSCSNNDNPHHFDLVAKNPNYIISRFELFRRAPSCDGSEKDVGIGFHVSRPPEAIQVKIYYGGGGELNIGKIVLQTFAKSD